MSRRIVFRCRVFMIGIAMLGVIGTSSLSAQSQPLSVEPLISNTLGFGVSGGYYVCDNAHLGSGQLQFVSRLRIGSILAFEAGLGYTGEQRFNFVANDGTDLAANVHNIPLTGSLLLFLPLAPTFTPYLMGGLGAHYMILDYSSELNGLIADKSKTRFGYHLGFGLEVPLNNHLALLGDYRYLFVDNAFEKELEVDFSSTEYRASMLSVGVVVYF